MNHTTSSISEDDTRILFCVEMETLTIEWSLRVASTLWSRKNFYACPDSSDPRVVFLSANHMQGVSDTNFNDRYGYLSIVNAKGELLYNEVVSAVTSPKNIIPAETEGWFYVTHDVVPIDGDPSSGPVRELAEPSDTVYHISKFSCAGEWSRSVVLPGRPRAMWLHTYGEESTPAVFATVYGGAMFVFDTSLTLLAESKTGKLGGYMGEISISGQPHAQVFELGIYSPEWEKLMSFPFSVQYFEILASGPNGVATDLLIGHENVAMLGQIEKKSFLRLFTIFYVKNQTYFLMVLSGLIVGMLVLNYYRRKTKQNLKLIADQKHQLDQSHLALQEAQATILAQEKYRQAKDIAGGFAHEIRNALFPARSALNRIISSEEGAPPDHQDTRKLSLFADEAIDRAVRMTRLVSEYTKIESVHKIETINVHAILQEVIRSNQLRMEQQGVTINMPPLCEQRVMGNSDQFYTVFNNLLLNSLDALTDTENPVILVKWSHTDGFLLVKFTDNGSGMSGEDAGHAFDVFYSTKPGTGTGLGLAMTRKIIELYDGSITVNSTPGKGTSFELKLKCSQDSLV